MAAPVQKRRRGDDEAARPKKKFKKVKKQSAYHSSSEDEDEVENGTTPRASDAPRRRQVAKPQAPPEEPQPEVKSKPKSILKQSITAPDTTGSLSESEEEEEGQEGISELERNTVRNTLPNVESDDDDLEDDEPDVDGVSDMEDDDAASDSETSETSSQGPKSRKKRNDPDAFATSISKILGTKLSTSKRQDPLLSRSRSAAEANKTLADSKLEQKARAQIRAEKKQVKEKGRVRDVLGLQTPEVDTGSIVEEEKKLKKTAQRGVVKLFNAVRAAQVKAEEALRQARSDGMVGMQKREEKVNEMSKQGFLDLISSGGKTAAPVAS